MRLLLSANTTHAARRRERNFSPFSSREGGLWQVYPSLHGVAVVRIQQSLIRLRPSARPNP